MKWARVLAGTTLGHFDLPLSFQWLTRQKQLAHPFGFKRVINALRLAWLHRQALSFVPEELFGTFLHAHVWKTWIVGTGRHLQHIFHAPHTGRTRLRRDTPARFQPGQQSRFFQHLAHGFMADVLGIAQFHQATSEQA